MSRPKKILIADDEPDILEIIQFNLVAEGYEVITAKNGDEAIELERHDSILECDVETVSLVSGTVCVVSVKRL